MGRSLEKPDDRAITAASVNKRLFSGRDAFHD
jgi:hypothetical protein